MSTEGRAWVFHAFSLLSNRWHGPCSARHLWETGLSSCREEVCAIPPNHQLAPLPAEIHSRVHLGCTINLKWTSRACQPTWPISLHTSGCGPQLLDDFNLRHEHVNRMHEFSLLSYIYCTFSRNLYLFVSQAVCMCALFTGVPKNTTQYNYS